MLRFRTAPPMRGDDWTIVTESGNHYVFNRKNGQVESRHAAEADAEARRAELQARTP